MTLVKFFKSAVAGKAAEYSAANAGVVCFDQSAGAIYLDGAMVAQVAPEAAKAVSGIALSTDEGHENELKITYTDASSEYVAIDTDDYLGEDLVVTGVSGIGLKDGDELKSTDSLKSIIKRIVTKELGYKVKSNPSVVLKGVTAETIEVGSKVEKTLSYTFTDGKFTPVDGYTASDVAAGCVVTSATYSGDGVDGDAISYDMLKGTHNYNVTVNYDASTAKPKTNLGNDDTVSIPAGSKTSANIALTGAYKYFYGYVAADASDSYATAFADQASLSSLTPGWIANSGNSSISAMTSTAAKSSLVLVLPSDAVINGTKNSLGSSVTVSEKWKKRSEISYTNGTSSLTYYVYVLHSGEAITYKEITFKK